MLSNKELNSKDSVVWSQKPRKMAKMVSKVDWKKRLEDGWTVEKGLSLGLFHPNTVEEETDPGDH